mmetsp:Transcript_28425/g.43598  ORF Transcript_28425/g.43598 Transcript_28425/m.43598 type:complete len:328 (-) Transcript_28425:179-1162(-)
MRHELDNFIRSNIVGGSQMSAKVAFMAKYLFACVCYHYDYLKNHLHHRNRLLSSTIFSHVPEQLRKLAVVRYPWNKTSDTPFLTGVPPHILMMSDIKQFENKLNTLGSEMMECMKDELNKRDIGGGMYHALQIQEEIRSLREEFSRLRTAIPCASEGGDDGSPLEDSTRRAGQRRLTQLHSYDGKLHILPKHFAIPTLTLASFIAFFLVGKPQEGVPPFRLVKPVDLKESNKGKKMNVKILTDMKKLMQYVERAGRELNVWEEDPENWTPATVTRLYETIHWKFRIKPARGLRRFEGLTWITYLGIIRKAKGKLVGDDDPIQGGITV